MFRFLSGLPTWLRLFINLAAFLLIVMGLHLVFYQETNCFSGGCSFFPYCAGEDFYDMARWVWINFPRIPDNP